MSNQDPFSTFFDVERLRGLVPVISMLDFVARCSRTVQVFISTGKGNRLSPLEKELGLTSVVRVLPLETLGNLGAMHAIDVACLEIGRMDTNKKMLGPYSAHGFQGYSWESSALFRLIRSHVLPSPELRSKANDYMNQSGLLSTPFLAIHVRRGDYLTSHCRLHKFPSIDYTCPSNRHIQACIERGSLAHLFVATNIQERKSLQRFLEKAMPSLRVHYLNDSFFEDAKPAKALERATLIEQWISIHATHWIGNRLSSWSSTVYSGRFMKGALKNSTSWWGDCHIK